MAQKRISSRDKNKRSAEPNVFTFYKKKLSLNGSNIPKNKSYANQSKNCYWDSDIYSIELHF
jgi:hypothetical protein